MGSTVVYGRGRAVVVGTGMDTEMGKIAGALAEAKEELTPLQVKLAELSRILTIMVIVICVVIFGVDIIRHGVGNVLTDPTALLDTFMVAVSLAVAAIPEGLVAVVTIVLSLGVTKMAKRQAIIRKLSAVETLGCTQTICSDKTGTLTQNKMTVVKHELAAPKEKFLAGMALCSDAQWDEELGEAVGEMYVERYFSPEDKDRMVMLVRNLQTALGQHINELDWMSDETKARAHEKLATFHVKIGYPDKWKDYTTLKIDPAKSYWENIVEANAWYTSDNISKLGKPVDKDEWHMSPQTVNAYYLSLIHI